MKILIVGLGVIGGGYAMALKEAGYSEVYGIDTNEETLKKAKEMKIIKEGFTREDEIISEMDLIVLALRFVTLQSLCIEWYLKTVISLCEEGWIKAEYIFNIVVEFVSHGSSSPFCLRCHYKTRKGILLAKIKK